MSPRLYRYKKMDEERSVVSADKSVATNPTVDVPNSFSNVEEQRDQRSYASGRDQRSYASGPPSVFSNERDDEAPSSDHGSDHGSVDDEPLILKGTEAEEGGVGQRCCRIVKSKYFIALFVILLLAGALVGGYFLSRVDRVNDIMQSSAQEDEDCPYTLEDIEALEQQIKTLEAALSVGNDCEFTLDDVEALREQVTNLEVANDRLADQLEDYEDLNNMLNASIQELNVQNEILEANNDEYERLNARLNASLAELGEHNAFLAEQVSIYAGLNQDLNATALHLEEQVDRLEGEVDDLTFQNDRLENLVEALNNETQDLEELVDLLESNVDRLEDHIEVLEIENDRLEGLVDDLQNIADFLADTANNLDETYEEVAESLSDQISTNRMLVVESLQNTYHQRVSNWDCGFRDRFALEDFAQDDAIAIPENRFQAVMAYVEERVLSELCLNTDDFVEYIEDRYPDQDITTMRLTTSVSRFTWDALDYYFPDVDDEGGLTPEDWATAGYDCGNLQPGKQYMRMTN